MRIAFLSITFLFLLASCQHQTSVSEKMLPNTFVNEEEDFKKWTAQLIANPLTQGQIDHNIIVNYIMDNKLDMKMTKSGLFYQIIQQGTGNLAKISNYATAHYRGYTLDGKEFDSSYSRNAPFDFSINDMILGWQEGIRLLNPSSKALFLIPSRLAYGEKGHPAGIPPNTVLAFEMHLLRHR